MVDRCKAANAAGGPCGAQAIREGWCAWHDPQRAAEMTEARRRGGKARSSKARASKEMARAALSPAELEGLIGRTIVEVLEGKRPPAVGQAVAALVRAAVVARESVEVDERLRQLEANAGLADTGRVG